MAAAAAACNLIVGNESTTAEPRMDATVGRDATVGGDAATSPPPINRNPSCVEAKGGSWDACDGGGACVEPSAFERPLLDNTFTRIHATPAGVIAYGTGQRFLVHDVGEPELLDYRQALDLTADVDFVYELSRGTDDNGQPEYQMRRHRRGAVDAGSGSRSLQGFGTVLALAGNGRLAFTAIGPGLVFGTIRRSPATVTTRHVLAIWDTNELVFPVDLLAGFGSDEVTYDTRFNVYALGRVQPETTERAVQVLRRQPPSDAAITEHGSEWTTLDTSDATYPDGGPSPVYERSYVGLACDRTFMMYTRWGLVPRLQVLGPEMKVEKSDELPQSPEPRYYGGHQYWSVATDAYALYVVRTGQALDSQTPDSQTADTEGEIFVYDNLLALRARFTSHLGEQFRQLTVTDCYLYWLDASGALRRLRKPSSVCAPR